MGDASRLALLASASAVLHLSPAYGSCSVDAARTIVAEAGGIVRATEAVVGPLDAGEVVVVRGIKLSSGGAPLKVLAGAGLAWFEDCEFINTRRRARPSSGRGRRS